MGRPRTSALSSGGTAGSTVSRTVLPGGMRIITEQIPGVESVCIGVWLDVGSRDEKPAVAGVSHFLEHLLFKGTKRRSALDIASEMDAVGGESNAFTGREHTCYYARVRGRDLPLAVDVLADMVTSATLAEADIDSERDVVLEEIAMNDDDPADLAHEDFTAAVLGDHALARPIIGSVESISQMSRSQVAGYYRRRYVPSSTVVAVAGKLAHADAVRLVRKAFDVEGWLDHDATPKPTRKPRRARTSPHAGARLRHREGEQTHVILGGCGISRFDDRRFAFGLLSSALGGGMSSRLFQEVRETRGLAYSVYSFATSFADTGLWGVYAGCQPARLGELLGVTRELLNDISRNGITAEELARAKGQTLGGLVLGLEDTGSRMTRLGKGELSYGAHMELDELVAHIEAVTLDDVAQLSAELLGDPSTLVVVGPHTVAEVGRVSGMAVEKIMKSSHLGGRVDRS